MFANKEKKRRYIAANKELLPFFVQMKITSGHISRLRSFARKSASLISILRDVRQDFKKKLVFPIICMQVYSDREHRRKINKKKRYCWTTRDAVKRSEIGQSQSQGQNQGRIKGQDLYGDRSLVVSVCAYILIYWIYHDILDYVLFLKLFRIWRAIGFILLVHNEAAL